ncbi:hypothetical protein M406DRAFT_354071 [Cryphonectria parasitica EP155]|uniref:Uncharacterized protein n=1 Tax=Cryphonectria parasitica (strain ATCC 38755 / EP155) TaxID=660469 RepID=A0A9P5CTF2_CRYP1|nr:uncharacterized protein M406DRAFT_354071 [Cryphonectria parasitica EP155]KAF3769607.1 hypothetical protein M406DRAFT_354071 [Cryphonectria parasitica EP155]
MPTMAIPTRYGDYSVISKELMKYFPKGNFKIRVSGNHFICKVPTALTNNQIRAVEDAVKEQSHYRDTNIE